MKTLRAELHESFSRVRGAPLALWAMVLSFIYFAISKNDLSISIKVFLPIYFILALLSFVFADCCVRLHRNSGQRLPKVKLARPPTPPYSSCRAVLLLEPSEIFGHESLVSVFHVEDGFEKLVGVGYVLTRQEDGLIQVLVLEQKELNDEQVWKRILSNDVNTLPRVLVKPSIPKSLQEVIRS